MTILQGSSIQGNPDYNPDTLTVKSGDVITVVNEDTVPHTVTSGAPSDSDAGALFDTSIVFAGKSVTIDTSGLGVGEYDYFCQIHPYMAGKLIVTE